MRLPDKGSVAERLAQAHFRMEPEIRGIYRLERSDGREEESQEPVKLLEVNPDTIAVGIEPIYFAAHAPSGIFYPSIIVEVTPNEFEQIESGKLPLPEGWKKTSQFSRDVKRKAG